MGGSGPDPEPRAGAGPSVPGPAERPTGTPHGAYPGPGPGPGPGIPGPPPPGYGATPPPPGYGAPGYGATPPPAGYGTRGYGTPGWAPAPAFGDPAGAGQLAGWWYRVAATLIDGIILVIFESVVGAILGGGLLAAGGGAAGAVGLARVVDAAGALAYQGLLLSYRGQTVGMMAVGTRIVDARSGGGISVGRALLRALIEGVFAVLLLIPWLVDVLWPLGDGRNQTLHDKIVGTLILRDR